MRKTELAECPKWLLDANTENEDVDLVNGILIWRGGDFWGGDFWGGNFLGGDFWGGNFLGGNFRGGNFLGGDFRGGNFWGGDFRGGNFLGGDFLGGNFLGGNFLGGDFLGGNFLGGNFLGGNFRGEKLTRPPISIYGLKNWYVQITPLKMHIGCQHHTHQEWKDYTDKEIANMHSDAKEFWRVNKAFLLSICDYEALVSNCSVTVVA